MQKIKNIYHLLRTSVAHMFYGFPSGKLKLIGVTGTDGKTTTTHLIYHILKTAQKSVSMISTIYAKIGDKEYDTGFHVTTPDGTLIPKYLHEAVKQKQEYFVLETTSHRLDQNQLFGVDFYIGVITNITHEHLDYHHSYKEYVLSKSKLLSQSRTAVINHDDESFDFIVRLLHNNKKLVTYGLKKPSMYDTDFKMMFESITDFNAYNYLAAYAVCDLLKIPKKTIEYAMGTFQLPPGRVEVIYDRSFKIIVDFAHTPNAVFKILETVKKQYVKKGSRLIHVFGSAGLRDRTKRFAMGQSSATFADYIILTEEDYRTEDPVEICREIGLGIKKLHKTYDVIIDRQSAIRKAIQIAKPDDTIIITGKGHEKSLCRGTIEYPWDDKNAVLTELTL